MTYPAPTPRRYVPPFAGEAITVDGLPFIVIAAHATGWVELLGDGHRDEGWAMHWARAHRVWHGARPTWLVHERDCYLRRPGRR